MDISTLSSLYAGTPPFAVVSLDVGGTAPDAAERLDIAWKDVQRDLAEAGLPEPARQALTEARGEHAVGTRVLVADATGVLWSRTFAADPTDASTVSVGSLPALLPVLQHAQTQLPHLLVTTDRAGADVFVFTAGPVATAAGSVSTDAWPLHKTNPGGWDTYRYEHSVEEDWKTNAHAVAEQVADAAKRYDVKLAFVAGDVHAIGLLRESLPADLAVHEVAGSRHPDGSSEETQEQVDRALSAHLLGELDALLEDLATYRGRAENRAASDEETIKGVDGVGATVEALQQAQVGTLLIAEDIADTPLSYGEDGTAIAVAPHDLTQLGVELIGSAPQADVLIRSALLTGADVKVVPATHPAAPTDGVGALLRFPVAG